MYKAIEVTKVLKGQKVPHGKNSFEPLNTLKVFESGHQIAPGHYAPGHNIWTLYQNSR